MCLVLVGSVGVGAVMIVDVGVSVVLGMGVGDGVGTTHGGLSSKSDFSGLF